MIVALSASAQYTFENTRATDEDLFSPALSVLCSGGCGELDETGTFTLVYKLSLRGKRMSWTDYLTPGPGDDCETLVNEADRKTQNDKGYLILRFAYTCDYDKSQWICGSLGTFPGVQIVDAWIWLKKARPFSTNYDSPLLIHSLETYDMCELGSPYTDYPTPFDDCNVSVMNSMRMIGAVKDRGSRERKDDTKAFFALNWLTATKGSANNSQAVEYSSSFSDGDDDFVVEHPETGETKAPWNTLSMLLLSNGAPVKPMNKVLGKDCPEEEIYLPKKFKGCLSGDWFYVYAEETWCPEYVYFCVEARFDKKMTKLHNQCDVFIPGDPGCELGETPDLTGDCGDCQFGPVYKSTGFSLF
jgi:hypothetical protein